MEKAEYQKHYELERDFWWFKSRREAAFRILARALKSAKRPARILDGGCGTGINLTALDSLGESFGCDLAREALVFCRRRGLTRLTRADVRSLPFLPGRFDLVTLFDVLYHKEIPDDVAVLREVRRVLTDGGLFLMTDSALEILRGPHDEAMQGLRRYNKKELRSKLEGAGFEVLRLSYFFMSTVPAVYLKRRRERRRAARNPGAVPRSDLEPVPRWLNRFLCGILRVEAAWAARRDLPIGSSIIALARKKN
jgi:SAM-dependent methyltransferase